MISCSLLLRILLPTRLLSTAASPRTCVFCTAATQFGGSLRSKAQRQPTPLPMSLSLFPMLSHVSAQRIVSMVSIPPVSCMLMLSRCDVVQAPADVPVHFHRSGALLRTIMSLRGLGIGDAAFHTLMTMVRVDLPAHSDPCTFLP